MTFGSAGYFYLKILKVALTIKGSIDESIDDQTESGPKQCIESLHHIYSNTLLISIKQILLHTWFTFFFFQF